MPRLSMIVAAGLALTTLGGCASGELVSSARESKATPSNIAAPVAESPELTSTPRATTTRPVAPAAAPRSTAVTPTPTTVTPPAGADLTAVTDAKLGRLVADQNGMTV